MTEQDAIVFLVALAVLLGMARLLGELARAVGMPLVVGELLAGILLGPTVFGRILPGTHAWLFLQPAPQTMLGAYTTLGVVLLLVVAGLEVDLGVVRRRGRSALFTSVLGMVVPLAGGLLLGYLLPESDMVNPDQRGLFAAFIGVALSISALPVIAKTLLDLGLFKTDLGLLVMAAAMINDIVGWLAFSMLVGPMQGGTLALGAMGATTAVALVFVVGVVTVGRRAIDRLLGHFADESHGGRVLSLVILFALIGASVTQALGIHAVLGGFVVGVAIGDSPRLKERTRAVVHEFVTNVFAPVFFASLGLRVDFVQHFDLRICVLVFVVASVAKVFGGSLGARAGGLRWRESFAVGFGLKRAARWNHLPSWRWRRGSSKSSSSWRSSSALGIAHQRTRDEALLYRATEEDVVALLRAPSSRLTSTTSAGAIGLVRARAAAGAARPARATTSSSAAGRPTGLGKVAVPTPPSRGWRGRCSRWAAPPAAWASTRPTVGPRPSCSCSSWRPAASKRRCACWRPSRARSSTNARASIS